MWHSQNGKYPEIGDHLVAFSKWKVGEPKGETWASGDTRSRFGTLAWAPILCSPVDNGCGFILGFVVPVALGIFVVGFSSWLATCRKLHNFRYVFYSSPLTSPASFSTSPACQVFTCVLVITTTNP